MRQRRINLCLFGLTNIFIFIFLFIFDVINLLFKKKSLSPLFCYLMGISYENLNKFYFFLTFNIFNVFSSLLLFTFFLSLFFLILFFRSVFRFKTDVINFYSHYIFFNSFLIQYIVVMTANGKVNRKVERKVSRFTSRVYRNLILYVIVLSATNIKFKFMTLT